MFEWLIKLFGREIGETKINKGAFKGKYKIYRFLGINYEIKVD